MAKMTKETGLSPEQVKRMKAAQKRHAAILEDTSLDTGEEI
jgi:hypothetical protein